MSQDLLLRGPRVSHDFIKRGRKEETVGEDRRYRCTFRVEEVCRKGSGGEVSPQRKSCFEERSSRKQCSICGLSTIVIVSWLSV